MHLKKGGIMDTVYIGKIITWLAIVAVTPTTIFQIVRNHKLKSAKGVSAGTFVSLLIGLALFFVGSLLVPTYLAISVNYLIGVCGASLVLSQKYYYAKHGNDSTSTEITMHPIGEVHNGIHVKTEELSWKNMYSDIVLDEKLDGALEGLDGYSHAYILFYFDKLNEEDKVYGKLAPYGFEDIPSKGIFATRMRQRPNFIACTLVRVVEIKNNNTLVVKGLDAFHGTPVIDIKPFTGTPRDVPGGCTIPVWAQRVNNPK